MSAISDDKLIQILQDAKAPERRVEMSKRGTFLLVDGEEHEISFVQADALFTTMFGHAPLKRGINGKD